MRNFTILQNNLQAFGKFNAVFEVVRKAIISFFRGIVTTSVFMQIGMQTCSIGFSMGAITKSNPSEVFLGKDVLNL